MKIVVKESDKSFIDLNDFIKEKSNSGRSNILYRLTCKKCNKDRGYQVSNTRYKACTSCAQLNKVSGNKGKTKKFKKNNPTLLTNIIKKCSCCNQDIDTSMFYVDKNSKDKLNSKCRTCCSNYSKEWTKANPSNGKESKKRYNSKPNAKEEGNKRRRERSLENPGAAAAKCAKRRSKKLQATPSWLTEEQVQEIKDIYKESAKLTQETGTPHHVDHIIALQGKTVSGLHVPWNLRVVTASENKKKANKLIKELI